MGAFDFFKSWVGRGAAIPGQTCKACIVDVSSLAGSGAHVPPKQKIQALQRLARYARAELVKVVAVLDGEELRSVAHGADYEGIKVYYAEKSANIGAALQEASRRQPDALVVTDNKEAEALVRGQGAATMRLSTFRKAFEAPRGDEGSNGDAAARSEGRRDRRPRGRGSRSGSRGDRRGSDRDRSSQKERGDRGDRGERGERGERGDRSERRESEAQSESRDPVSDLIDLV